MTIPEGISKVDSSERKGYTEQDTEGTGTAAMTSKKEFLEAVKGGNLAQVSALIDAAPGLISIRDEGGLSAILVAAYHGHPEIVALLLSRNPPLDLFEASAAGRLERVAALIEKEPALVNQISPDGFSPLHLAAFFGYPEAVSYLVDHGAEVNAASANPMRLRPLHSALAHRETAAVLKMAQILLSHGAEVNARQAGGWTPLHQAATHRVADLVRLLLERGADVNAKADNGKTPIDMAAQSGSKEVLNLLREFPAA